MPRRLLAASIALVLGLAVLIVNAAPASAARTVGWASWTPITGTANNYKTTMQLPAKGFPEATVASDSRANVQLPSGDSTFLGGSGSATPTDVGIKYGSSKGNAYLNLRPKADNASSPSTTTYTFAHPTPSTGWTFVLGDIDADQVQISAKDADGTPLTAAQINTWKAGHDTFNYAGDADLPTWDAATSTLVGNAGALDTNGASAWFEPDSSISSLTFVFTRRAGFPVYQTWFASVARTISGTVADVSASGSCPVDSATVQLTGPDGQLLATTNPVAGAYSFGQYATQAGYTVSIERPAGCAVVGDEQQTVSTAATDAAADFRLRKLIPQSVSGTVKSAAGDPVAGVEITLTPPTGPAKVTTTDADGHYLFDDNDELPGYTVAVSGVPTGFTTEPPASLAFDIPVGTAVTGKDFVLRELPAVTGTVTGGGGPLGAVTVTLTPSGGGPSITTETDGDGNYRFDHVPAGSYDIAVTPPPGYNAEPPRTGVAVGATDKTGQDFDLTRPGSIGGSVTDASSGDPVGDVAITVDGPGAAQTARTDGEGSYFLDGLAPGTYAIGVIAPDGYRVAGASTRTAVITTQGEIRGGLDFRVEPNPIASPTGGAGTSTGSTNPPPSGAIAATGADPEPALLLALVLIALGLGVNRAARPRRH